MRTSLLSVVLLALTTSVSASSDLTCPFERAILGRAPQPHDDRFKRQTTDPCGPNLQSCSFLSRPGAGSACCATNAVCTLDNAGNVACCPEGAFCTGTLSSVPATVAITTSTQTGATIITPVVTGSAPTYTVGQYINNAYFGFPVLWLQGAQFPDANQCAAAYQTCDSYYTACTNALQSGQQVPAGYGVTVSAPGGGFTAGVGGGVVTVGPQPVESATSICGSLRAVGCPGQGATCGGAQPTPTPTRFIVVPPSNKGERSVKTVSAAALLAILAGVVVAW